MREIVTITSAALAENVSELLQYCDIQEAVNMLSLNKSWFELLRTEESHGWTMLDKQLCNKYNIYVSPHAMKMRRGTRKEEFMRTWRYRDLWQADATTTTTTTTAAAAAADDDSGRAGETFNISVTCRFRPDDIGADRKRTVAGKRVVLPLHQRLEGIKKAQNCTTTSEAAKILMKESGRESCDPFKDVFSSKETTVQIEAQNQTTFEQPASILNITDTSVLALAPGTGMRVFDYDAAFNNGTQQEVYIAAASAPVRDFINGNDACCIVFGQTGSGKTYTMFGEGPNKGIVPLACEEVMKATDTRSHIIDADLAVSYVEIFGDELTDLLNGSAPLSRSKTAAQRWVLEGRAQHTVESLKHLEELLETGDQQKRRACTKMNDKSTRAHALVILTLKQTHLVTGAVVSSMLILADLGGSEDIRKSGVHEGIQLPGRTDGEEGANWNEYYQKRERLQEAIHINKGLLALKQCVRALHARQCGEKVHVPFQDSKLTHLLAPVIGGNASASVLITGSPCAVDALETVNTLRFGESCRAVVTSNSRLDATARAVQRMVAELDVEIAKAEENVKSSEKWVQKKIKRARVADVDENAPPPASGEGVEYSAAEHIDEEEEVTVYRLEGAEAEAQALEELLEQRRRLLGCA
eukprot:TRINITY_DN3047_c0_g1_i2.p1 TRINITY_DN3047_c0_g1~~TRINITY_DN3047_c0_g1_i2.p1  ORF type:complete len:641 (+),score=202.16 TRINITY_DN3047_c0_g1_i2:77-1999(+)